MQTSNDACSARGRGLTVGGSLLVELCTLPQNNDFNVKKIKVHPDEQSKMTKAYNERGRVEDIQRLPVGSISVQEPSRSETFWPNNAIMLLALSQRASSPGRSVPGWRCYRHLRSSLLLFAVTQ